MILLRKDDIYTKDLGNMGLRNPTANFVEA
jgi:hypothetical protein